MKAYLAIKFYEDNRNRDKIDRISTLLSNNRIKTICITRDAENWGEKIFQPKELMKITFEQIKSSNFVLIDLTEKGVGLGIEAGYAYANGIPIITIAEETSDISNTLKGISKKVILYKNIQQLNKIFKVDNIRRVLDM
ncbi:nucleoside 2-deoxyribosyltransferase [Clostridium sp. D2Q-11]|uniref:Nucleoside 2-deoxyribosyltransferase n=1 Tax=Anaeromonas frigoriresistens TaxID=2683708 RepID=A0A942UTK2_9FIRM|nr:nucleoside 2-deoxyribosyltransferase [Anaeromonas frigoriresistens]MBS4538893.1 nucleoside 2-deoxyribosyltransferase [Anaeromonas frigoriresistens]